MDLGSERIMSRQLENYGINILQLHAEWLMDNGYKLQASSAKKQIRMILINKKKKKQKATSFKLDSDCRMLQDTIDPTKAGERMWRYHFKYRVASWIKKGIIMDNEQLKRIADAVEKRTNYRTGEVTELRGIRNALEEILHLVKKDMQKYEKKKN